ncbi:phenylalanine--tRNA ligase subunit beta [Candidatus Kaiserbacteria bacterium]|nr:phenylalanine--tRNA ligase subunit beta [Candidatus Kaiserbacteria bacterium]
MKISREWLQTYFDTPLPSAEEIGHALTFHAFEIESVESVKPQDGHGAGNDILDVKVTPNRGHDCLSYRGIAKEVSAILNISLKDDVGLRKSHMEPRTNVVSVHIENPELCARYVAGYIKGVKVGPSPKWLVDRLAAMGQHSINNVVDATNYVMFNIGQPLHAFDAGKLKENNGYSIVVRTAKNGEKIVALDEKEFALKDSMLIIVDGNSDEPIGIAGVKGGMPAGISEATKDIIIESANFNGISVRKTAQALKLRTDASQRFEQQISPELAGYGMRAAAELINEFAGGELVGFVDEYPAPQQKKTVSVSLEKINKVLGTQLTQTDIEDAFTRLGAPPRWQGSTLTLEVPFERLDLNPPAGGPEDLVEEVGRIVGYDKVPAVELPPFEGEVEINANFCAAEHAREELVAKGYSEVVTSVFADKGERVVANKVDGVKPYLRATLTDGLKEAFDRNNRNKDLLGLDEIRLFEIGTIWKGGKEVILLGTIDKRGAKEIALKTETAVAYNDLATSHTDRYQPFSKYPAIVRDIALWVPTGTSADEVESVLVHHAGDLLVKHWKFDEFAKGDKISYAFRLVFQSFDRTLFDGDANERMESIYTAINEKSWEVR